MKIQESAENYLETILILSEKNAHVRSIDIATELHFTKPSVSVAMKKLRENDFIRMDSDGFITLTESGMEIAARMYERHRLLSDWLVYLGVSRETAVGGRVPHRARHQPGELREDPRARDGDEGAALTVSTRS